MNASLADTFDGLFNVEPKCVVCGGLEGELTPTIWTNETPSHYAHARCLQQREEQQVQAAEKQRIDEDRTIRMMTEMD